MHIDGWSIDAFGALQDVERRGIGEGLTVIHGPNEAGKSTLRHFVLGVLFGFTAGNTKNPLYAPPPARHDRDDCSSSPTARSSC